MRLQRFIGDFNIKSGPFVIRDAEIMNQVKNVLRLEVGDKIIICDGKGIQADAEIIEPVKKELNLILSNMVTSESPITQEVVLYCAILKKENFELVVQKATEIGISKIIPLITKRTIKLGLNKERLEKIAREASEQSGRTFLPKISEPMEFEEALKNTGSNLNLFFDSSGSSFGICNLDFGISTIGVWIGPEGGWADEEVSEANAVGFKIISLGPLTLRAETAAISASYLICSHLYR
jgi:16S rRNA (uracil1498-N3)-methyltransferase